MKKSFKYILLSLVAGAGVFGSCTDYLEKDDRSVLSKEDAFKNFRNFQGYVEVINNVIPDVAKHNWVSSFNWGEDEVITTGNGEYLMGFQIDGGNYRSYIGKGDCFLDRNWAVDQIMGSAGARFDKALWGGGWYAIRQANMGLQALEEGLMTEATDEERNTIKGELLFWRAFCYFNLTAYWGGLPYMTEPLSPNSQFNLPRESYQECAEKMAQDFADAAKLLPLNWDDAAVGQTTKTNNDFRPNKIWAMAYQGKSLLYAGSPLMENGADATGDTYKYNTKYCEEAAKVLGELLEMVEAGKTQYSLVDFSDYSELFYTKEKNWLMPGSTEAIVRSPSFGADSYWRQMNSYQIADIAEGDGIVLCPSANYVNYFGMANGLPLNDPNSGFSKTQPWKNRDPRFYYSFIYDGVKMVKSPSTDSGKEYEYANFCNGGNGVANPQKTSRTGYLNYRFIPIGANKDDADYGYAKATHFHLSWLRLAEVYLMYAEAEGIVAGADGKATGCSMSAVDAVNKIRERAGVAAVDAAYTGSKEKFIDEVRRERAVELAFEGHRFHDLRRWKLLTVYPYNIKTMQKFDRAAELDPSADTKENEVRNWAEETIVNRKLEAKHYWLPFNNDDVMMYPEFKQNPGW